MVEQQQQQQQTSHHTMSNSMKVYELAKELGLDSLSLLDQLATLNIKVKNHMSDLGEEELRIARDSFNKSKSSAKTTTAKKTTAVRRKKAAEVTDETATVTATKATATKTTKAAATTEATPTAGGPSPVIRRRVKMDDSGEMTTTVLNKTKSKTNTAEVTPEEQSTAAQTTADFTTPEQESFETNEAQDTTIETAVTSTEPVESTPVETSALDVNRPITRPVVSKKSFLSIVQHTPAQKPKIIAPASPQTKSPGPSGAVSPVTPKQGAVRGQTTQDKDGFRVIRMTKENLDQMAEEENQKKKGAGLRETDIKPEDVRFADYRKKEVVFLPKKKKIPVGKELKRTEKTVAAAHKRVVEMNDTIVVSDLAQQMSVKSSDVIRKLMMMGTMANINQSIDFETATLIASEFKFETKNISFKEESVLEVAQDTDTDLMPRPPVVTIMGHVDHGKTTLLDAIRSANVAGGEFGGITQHIGAYTVEKNGKKISFIDTPGHEAFTAMRARGANVTDIVILVVAADDAVMPQTREALSHAKAAGVPIIVAVNKTDKPGANPEKVKQQLAELDLLAEDWGGQTMFIPVSALQKTGIDQLLESILLQAEVLDLKANPNTNATGTVLEARLEKGRGPVASVLVKRGTLKPGDVVVSGQSKGRVKALTDDKGNPLSQCLPGEAAEILGFDSLPPAGEKFDAVDNEQAAEELVENRRLKALQEKSLVPKMSLEELFSKVQAGETKELGVILKADVSGSVEAVKDSLVKLSTEKVKIKVLFAAPGGITESDILLATASNAVIIGFNVRPETKARALAEREHIEIKCYNIIYELIDDIKLSMSGLLDKKKVEKYLGRAEVRQTFSVPKAGTIAGCSVVDGKILRGANVRLLRDSRVIFDGKLNSLKRFKDDAKEVAEGFECGMGIENYNDIKIGDLIEAYQIDLVAQEM